MSDGQPHLVPPPERRCRFVKTNGARCTYHALRDRDLCFDHNRKRETDRGRHKPALPAERMNLAPLVTFAHMEDHHSILYNLNQIAQAFGKGAIDYRQAGAMNSLMSTCLKTLRQMHEIQKLQKSEEREKPVDDYVEEEGQPMAIPDTDETGHPIDPHADPNYPGISFDPDTAEGSRNREQRLLWEYFSNDPASGIPCVVDIHWPGGRRKSTPPATPQTPSPAAQPATKPAAGSNPSNAPNSENDADLGFTMQAAADPSFLTPAESMRLNLHQAVNPFLSTHTQKPTLPPFLFKHIRKTAKNYFRIKSVIPSEPSKHVAPAFRRNKQCRRESNSLP